MTKNQATVIIIVLSGIFAVLLFGREHVPDSLQTIFWLGIIGIAGYLLWLLLSASPIWPMWAWGGVRRILLWVWAVWRRPP
jgi:hypothetical protein